MPKILFLATHPKEIASTRYRVLAYWPALREHGYEIGFHPFFPTEALQTLYGPGRWAQKTGWVLRGVRARRELLRGATCDLLFIHRELFPLGLSVGMALFERELRRLGGRLMYDFDDAVFLPHRQNRGLVGKLENPVSVQQLIARSDRVIAGNAFLAGFARRLNAQVECIPTPVDTSRYFPAASENGESPCVIGWIGSPSTAKYLRSLAPVFERLARRYPFRLKVIGAGNNLGLNHLPIDCRPWNLTTEAEEFRNCDIGVYPLWDDEWSRGKCGYKALQFMASGVPVVASRVGMNTEIIQDRVNGLLAQSEEEWTERLSELLEERSLRRRLGEAGRQAIGERYSLDRLAPRFLQTLEETLPPRRQAAAAFIPADGKAPTQAAEHQDILCFSSIDWDFVWQGHQEIMTTLARQGHRVLFVENTGVRSLRLQDVARIQQRLAKWGRSVQGFWQVEENLVVFSPLLLPFPYSRLARWINSRLLFSPLQRWMQVTDFQRPVCWTFLPTPLTLDLIHRIPRRLLVYYCIDSFVDSTPAARRIFKSEQELIREADLVFVTSQALHQHASRANRRVHLFPFGVSLKEFERAREEPPPWPEELKHLKRPIIGYVGGIHQWVDQELLAQTASRRPDHTFVLIGPVQTNVERLKREPNILLLGQRAHRELPRYVQAFDAGIIPYRLTDYTHHVYPTKLNEYLAMAKPVVSTRLAEVVNFDEHYGGLVEFGENPASFGAAIDRSLQGNGSDLRPRRIAAAQDNAWSDRIETMQGLIQESVARQRDSAAPEDWAQRLTSSRRANRGIQRGAWIAGLLLAALFWTPFIWWCGKPLQVADAPAKADAIVVFAGGVGELGQPAQSYQERLKQAVELYRRGYAPEILFLSGYTWTFQEAELMKVLSKDLGVPPAAIFTETDVGVTLDYCRRVEEWSKKRGWRSVLLVTAPYHSRRAGLTLARQAPALAVIHTPLKESRFYTRHGRVGLDQIRGILHEYLAILVYRLRGWL